MDIYFMLGFSIVPLALGMLAWAALRKKGAGIACAAGGILSLAICSGGGASNATPEHGVAALLCLAIFASLFLVTRRKT